MRGGRADIDPNGAQLQPLGRDVAGIIVFVMTEPAMRVLGAVMRMRQRSVGLRRGR